ncbi:MAG: translation initiation factor IF-5A [Candidatus Aenigmarchaeota archaeon]|nr:translation initiation factor IF-5A [Candidatus Aenigmarchaeota archaeon]
MAEKIVSLKEIKVGSYVMVDGEPCKATKVELSKPGKHGSAKARVEAVGLFDDKKRSILKPADTDVGAPIIEKKGGQIISVSGNVAQIMDLTDYSTFDITIPDDLKTKILPGAEIVYWKFEDRVLLKG